MEQVISLNVTPIELKNLIQDAVKSQFEKYRLPETETDEIGGIELAAQITGKAVPTIYNLCADNKIPHSKRGNKLYFSSLELKKWIRNGKRKTQDEISQDAENFNNKK